MRSSKGSGTRRVPAVRACSHACSEGTNLRLADTRQFRFALADELPKPVGLKIAPESRLARYATRRRPAAVVVLHLRSRYVSKAAILTIPVRPVPGENRSPA